MMDYLSWRVEKCFTKTILDCTILFCVLLLYFVWYCWYKFISICTMKSAMCSVIFRHICLHCLQLSHSRATLTMSPELKTFMILSFKILFHFSFMCQMLGGSFCWLLLFDCLFVLRVFVFFFNYCFVLALIYV
jgi:hypothetical protein